MADPGGEFIDKRISLTSLALRPSRPTHYGVPVRAEPEPRPARVTSDSELSRLGGRALHWTFLGPGAGPGTDSKSEAGSCSGPAGLTGRLAGHGRGVGVFVGEDGGPGGAAAVGEWPRRGWGLFSFTPVASIQRSFLDLLSDY